MKKHTSCNFDGDFDGVFLYKIYVNHQNRQIHSIHIHKEKSTVYRSVCGELSAEYLHYTAVLSPDFKTPTTTEHSWDKDLYNCVTSFKYLFKFISHGIFLILFFPPSWKYRWGRCTQNRRDDLSSSCGSPAWRWYSRRSPSLPVLPASNFPAPTNRAPPWGSPDDGKIGFPP